MVRLTPEERARIGLVTQVRPAKPYPGTRRLRQPPRPRPVTELTNSYAGAVGRPSDRQGPGRGVGQRRPPPRALGTAAIATAQIETAEGTALTEQAAVTAAESQVRTLAATARQEWGPVLGRAIIERGPLVTR